MDSGKDVHRSQQVCDDSLNGTHRVLCAILGTKDEAGARSSHVLAYKELGRLAESNLNQRVSQTGVTMLPGECTAKTAHTVPTCDGEEEHA